MFKRRIGLLLLLLPSVLYGQAANSNDPRLKIDYWLKKYTQVTRTDKAGMAQEVFANLLTVADKPIGVLPKLYIFSNLEFQKVFALPDGSIVLPLSVIDFCARSRKDAKARLAFLLGHELKHIVRDDYWIQRIFEFTSAKEIGRDNKEMQRLWETMEWDLSLQVRRAKETEADEYGILYASLAGYNIRAIVSPSDSFISEYYLAAGVNIHGDLTHEHSTERLNAVNRRLNDIITHLDLFDFGVRLYAIGKYEAAIEVLQKFATQYPAREVFNNLGMCYYQNALIYYSKWKLQEIDKDPNLVFRVSAQIDPMARFQEPHRSAGAGNKQAFIEMIDKAIDNFKEANARDATYEFALNNLGCAYLLKGELDFAKGNFKKVLELDPNCKEAYNNLGVALFIEGNAREATTHFLAALSQRADYLDSIYNLGQLNNQIGRTDEATEYYQKYLQLDGTSIYADNIRKRLGIRVPSSSSRKMAEKIGPSMPVRISQSNQVRWNQFLTPSADISVCHDTTQATEYFQFVSKQSRERISLMLWTERYQGATEKGISIGAPERYVDELYPYAYNVKETTLGAFRVYNNLGLVFEMRNHQVHNWFRFEVM